LSDLFRRYSKDPARAVPFAPDSTRKWVLATNAVALLPIDGRDRTMTFC
jgi:hypothetical protein